MCRSTSFARVGTSVPAAALHDGSLKRKSFRINETQLVAAALHHGKQLLLVDQTTGVIQAAKSYEISTPLAAESAAVQVHPSSVMGMDGRQRSVNFVGESIHQGVPYFLVELTPNDTTDLFATPSMSSSPAAFRDGSYVAAPGSYLRAAPQAFAPLGMRPELSTPGLFSHGPAVQPSLTRRRRKVSSRGRAEPSAGAFGGASHLAALEMFQAAGPVPAAPPATSISPPLLAGVYNPLLAEASIRAHGAYASPLSAAMPLGAPAALPAGVPLVQSMSSSPDARGSVHDAIHVPMHAAYHQTYTSPAAQSHAHPIYPMMATPPNLHAAPPQVMSSASIGAPLQLASQLARPGREAAQRQHAVATRTPHSSTRRSKHNYVYSTSKTAYFMEPGDPNPVLLTKRDASTLARPAAVPAEAVRLGLVSMLKKPAHVETWLTYYRDVIGIERFFLKVEDTPELEPFFSQEPWCQLVDVSFESGTHRDYFTQMDRQSSHMVCSVPKARECGLTHLLHVDDDELIYCSAGVDVLRAELARASPSQPDLHMLNIEALYPSEACNNPFKETTVFRHFPTKYCSYTNGKSFGRLDADGLRSHGPHHFRCSNGAGGSKSAVTHMIPPWVATVLHYESASFRKWRRKFVELAARHGDDEKVFARVPFTFYKQSILAALRILESEADPEKLRQAEVAALELWREYKLAPSGLPPPISGKPQILPGGLTVLSPWLTPPDFNNKPATDTPASIEGVCRLTCCERTAVAKCA